MNTRHTTTTRDRLARLGLLALTLLAAGCPGGERGEDTEVEATSCPFAFAELTGATFDEPGSPALLTFPVFPDGELEQVGADGSATQLIAQSIQPFIDSDGRQDRSPSITFIQNTRGPNAVFTPAEVGAEYDRLANNAAVTLGATTSNTTVELGGQDANVLVASADASLVATVFVPVDDGAFFAPVSLGVYAGRAGCGSTMEDTFEALLAGVALNADSTFDELEAVVELKAEKQN
jgi:hypothetical protein